jgi:hypothetical protein
MLTAAIANLVKSVSHSALLTIQFEYSPICLVHIWTATHWKDNFILKTPITNKALEVHCDAAGGTHKGKSLL